MHSRAIRTAAVALALLASTPMVRAGGGLTSLPAGSGPTTLNNVSGLPSGYTFVDQVIRSGTLSNGAVIDLTQSVYKNSQGQLGFLYSLFLASVPSKASVQGFSSSDFNVFSSGDAPLSAGFYGGQSNQQVFASRPDSDGNTVDFSFFKPLTTSGTTLNVFVATTATKAVLTGSTSITPNGSGGSLSVQTFQAAPEPGALALVLLGVPLVGTACYRRWQSRPRLA
jgi:hypothetical protein